VKEYLFGIMQNRTFGLSAAICGFAYILLSPIAFWIGNPTAYFIFQAVLATVYTACWVLLIPILKHSFANATERIKVCFFFLLTVCNSFTLFGQLFFLDNRTVYLLLTVTSALSFLYLALQILREFAERIRSGVGLPSALGSGVFVFIFAFPPYCLKVLIELIHLTTVDFTLMFVIPLLVALGLAAVVAALQGILQMKKSFRTRAVKIKKVARAAGSTLLLSFMILAFSLPALNYALDFSAPTAVEKTVISKHYSHGISKSPGSYVLDLGTTEFYTFPPVYDQCSKGDKITLCEHRGALGFSYYEYRLDEVYRYR